MNRAISDTTQPHAYFLRFINGDEAGLTYLYGLLHKKLRHHGLRIVSDEFFVNSSIQEAFLKAWNFRDRLTSLLHTYRFLRLNVSWKCYDYYRKPDRLRNYIVYADNMDGYTSIFGQQEDSQETIALTEERLQSIYRVLPYLPANRKTVFILHFKYGLSYKLIAKRLAWNSQAVVHELQRGIEQLKGIIHSQKRLSIGRIFVSGTVNYYPETLPGELLQIFRLRYENKWGFEAIAAQMNLPLDYVQQQYITAHKLLNQMRKQIK